LRHIVKLAAALCAAASIVHAAPISYLAADNINSTPVSAANPLPITGSISAGAPFAPTSATSNASLAVSTTSANVPLPSGATVLIQNVTANTIYVALGTTSGVTATASGFPIAPYQNQVMAVGSNTFLAGIVSSGTGTLLLSGGSGTPIMGNGIGNIAPGAGPFGFVGPSELVDQSGLPIVTGFGSALPASGQPFGAVNGGNLVYVGADGSHDLNVNCAAGCSNAATTAASGGASVAANSALAGQEYLSAVPTWSTTANQFPLRAGDTHGDLAVCTVSAAGTCIDLSVPSTATSTQAATTLGSAGTFSSVLASNTSRKGCLVENTSAENEWVYFGATGSATTANSLKVAAGYAVNCSSGPIVASDNIAVAGSVSSGDTVVVVSQ
jgi:hypothetical protein